MTTYSVAHVAQVPELRYERASNSTYFLRLIRRPIKYSRCSYMYLHYSPRLGTNTSPHGSQVTHEQPSFIPSSFSRQYNPSRSASHGSCSGGAFVCDVSSRDPLRCCILMPSVLGRGAVDPYISILRHSSALSLLSQIIHCNLSPPNPIFAT